MRKNKTVFLICLFTTLKVSATAGKNLRQEDPLDKLMEEIKHLDTELLTIANEVEKQQLELKKQNSNLANLALKIDFKKLNRQDLVDFELVLDGFPIIEFNELNDYWLNQDEMLIYDGPVNLGKHAINLTARFSIKSNSDLNTEPTAKLTQAFEIDITDKENQFAIEFLQDAHSTIALLKQNKKPSL